MSQLLSQIDWDAMLLAIQETIFMTFISLLIAVILGFLLGFILSVSSTAFLASKRVVIRRNI